MASIVAIGKTLLDQIKVHLRGYDASVVWCHVGRHSVNEVYDILLLLDEEILQYVGQLCLLLGTKHLNRLVDLLYIVLELDLPEVYPVKVTL